MGETSGLNAMTKPKHTLTFVADHEGQLFVYADAKGLAHLIASLEQLKQRVDAGECGHDHLYSDAWAGSDLSESKGCESTGDLIHHVKLYGWTDEAAEKHGFRS